MDVAQMLTKVLITDKLRAIGRCQWATTSHQNDRAHHHNTRARSSKNEGKQALLLVKSETSPPVPPWLTSVASLRAASTCNDPLAQRSTGGTSFSEGRQKKLRDMLNKRGGVLTSLEEQLPVLGAREDPFNIGDHLRFINHFVTTLHETIMALPLKSKRCSQETSYFVM